MFTSSDTPTDRNESPHAAALVDAVTARPACSGVPVHGPHTCPLAPFAACGTRPGTALAPSAARGTRGARRVGTVPAEAHAPGHTNSANGAGFDASGAAGVTASVPAPNDDRLWDPAETAAFLGMSESWVYTAARSGVLPAVLLGRAVRFDPATLRAWVRGERAGRVVQLPRCR